MINIQTKNKRGSFWLFTCSFLLLWEWLRPIEQLTNTGNIGVFLGYILFSLLLYMANAKLWIRFFVKSFYMLVALHALYYRDPFFSLAWIRPFLNDLMENMILLTESDWANLSNLFRTLLFFLLLNTMTYLLRYWMMVRRRIFLFFLMTILYITILDTFSSYESDWAIVRTVIIGFVMLGLLTFYRQIEKNGMKVEKTMSRKWIVSMLAFIVVSVSVGFSVPKPAPFWADPVPYLKSYSEKSGGVNTVGYGTDDSQLGGAFIGNNELVFQAEVESRHYWKVETKDVYTGKGWVTSDNESSMIPFEQNEEVPKLGLPDKVETVQESATIIQSLKYPHLVYPTGLKEVDADQPASFEMHPVTEKIYSSVNKIRSPLQKYSLTYDVPKYNVKSLLESNGIDPIVENDHFMQQYTQLPVSLPPRVRELALEITAGKNTRYEQTLAIESYFDRPEYSYEKTDVLTPGEEDDYVDQFLFDSKKGYCDNFSSSMVVMLRTLGIPSRWVKGYSEGEFKRLADEGKRVFEITNNNAHSWVEVYFKNVGWVPFEPTKGFTNNVLFNYDTDSTTQATTPEPIKKEQPDVKQPKLESNDNNSFSLQEIWSWCKNVVANQFVWILVTLLALVVGVWMIYRSRKRWLPYFLIWKYKRVKQDKQFAQAYLELLKQFDRLGLKRKDDQTLRAYAHYVDQFYRTQDMGRLTSRYEQYLYKGSLPEGSWSELRELWEKLIKKTIA